MTNWYHRSVSDTSPVTNWYHRSVSDTSPVTNWYHRSVSDTSPVTNWYHRSVSDTSPVTNWYHRSVSDTLPVSKLYNCCSINYLVPRIFALCSHCLDKEGINVSHTFPAYTSTPPQEPKLRRSHHTQHTYNKCNALEQSVSIRVKKVKNEKIYNHLKFS